MSFTGTFTRKVAIKRSAEMPPQLKRVVTNYLVKYKYSLFAPTTIVTAMGNGRSCAHTLKRM